jgi:hypothetical protein
MGAGFPSRRSPSKVLERERYGPCLDTVTRGAKRDEHTMHSHINEPMFYDCANNETSFSVPSSLKHGSITQIGFRQSDVREAVYLRAEIQECITRGSRGTFRGLRGRTKAMRGDETRCLRCCVSISSLRLEQIHQLTNQADKSGT